MTNNTDRKTAFQKVALIMIGAKPISVIRGAASGPPQVCSLFLKDVAMVTEALLKASEEFANVHQPITADTADTVDTAEG